MDRTDRDFGRFVSWVLAHLFAYAAVAVAIRYLSHHIEVIEIAALRSAGSLVIAAALLRSSAAGSRSGTMEIGEDIVRSLLHLVGSLALVWSVAHLPLAYVATVEFTGPLFAALAGWLIGRKWPGRAGATGLAIIAGGCIMLLQRQGVGGDFRIMMPVLAVMLLTTTNLMLARLARTRRVASIIFIMHAIQLPAYLGLLTWFSPDWTDTLAAKAMHWSPVEWVAILLCGLVLSLAGFVTQAALANASRHGTPLQLCAADIIRLPMIALVGFLVFREKPDMALVVPGLIVLVGSVIAALPARTGSVVRA